MSFHILAVKKNYYDYVKNGVEAGNRPESAGGGLIRSMGGGGWSEVLAMRTRKERHVFDS